MAEEAAISFLLNNVKQLLTHQLHLIRGVNDEVASLQKDLEILQGFIEDASAKKNKEQSLKVWMRQVKDVIFKAEDAIDTFVIQAAEKKTQGFFAKMTNGPIKTLNIANDVETVKKDITHISRIFTDLGIDRAAALTTERGADTNREEKKVTIIRFREVFVGSPSKTIVLTIYFF